MSRISICAGCSFSLFLISLLKSPRERSQQFIGALVAISCFREPFYFWAFYHWEKAVEQTKWHHTWVQKQNHMPTTERIFLLVFVWGCLTHTHGLKGKLSTLLVAGSTYFRHLLEIWDVILLALMYLHSVMVHPNQWWELERQKHINQTPRKGVLHSLH